MLFSKIPSWWWYFSNAITKLITRNNQGPPTPHLKNTNLIYQYQCLHDDCDTANNIYIGMTTTTLSLRLTMHLASGGQEQHTLAKNNLPLTIEDCKQHKNIINQIQPQ